ADHIKGGFFTYRYLGPGSGTNVRYNITLTVYMICNPSSGQLTQNINFTFFDGGNFQFIQTAPVTITNTYNLSKVRDEPCISDDVPGCYYTIVVYDLASIELPSRPNGYIVSYQRCCRIAGIQNLTAPSNAVGNTFTTLIPGNNVIAGGETNNSPVFPVNDTAIVCRNNYFQLSFQASDPDAGDSLSYSFCDAFNGGGQPGGNCPTCNTPDPATAPLYSPVPYGAGFSGSQPMGTGVTINSSTGIISGTAPPNPGEYVICVCVREYKSGVLVATHRKELHINVKSCESLAPRVNPFDKTCDGFTRTFDNSNPSALINSYHWDFGVLSLLNDTSNLAAPSYTYADTGVYLVKLVVNRNQECSDSSTTVIRVYPGFFPGFRMAGGCITSPFLFTDTTRTNYGFVDSWSWNFGDETTLADTSHLQHPQWTYSTPGVKTVTLTVTNSKGCVS
ncbi:MAG: PKD domain-containing protein, partial [Chitinophagaceae bacterium]|nr:PKD domain-containing protein [Chitinophagaceae bacterium]